MTDREELIEKINAAIFTPVRTRSSYDMTHVDDFLDALVVALRQGRPVEPLVDMVRFSTVRFREGYQAHEVDRFLDHVVLDSKALPALDATAGPVPSAPVAEPDGAEMDSAVPVQPVPEAQAVEPGVIEEQRGLIGRLFRR
ncbi:DivIVA domain-containing protein [Nocardioides sp. JQ2195]|uniref:DivIVA domain-containing protein n=1 Tax=Nocardioides sp. JQ2195 TaxID=2592334 RepID=UPI00143E3787|nr:DivIVA domain-containing protein [Nocardioides sp. JQ2195]QIX26616.1 DivIVA domain-containing protein [Nocardioides sp. JQ2195]